MKTLCRGVVMGIISALLIGSMEKAWAAVGKGPLRISPVGEGPAAMFPGMPAVNLSSYGIGNADSNGAWLPFPAPRIGLEPASDEVIANPYAASTPAALLLPARTLVPGTASKDDSTPSTPQERPVAGALSEGADAIRKAVVTGNLDQTATEIKALFGEDDHQRLRTSAASAAPTDDGKTDNNNKAGSTNEATQEQDFDFIMVGISLWQENTYEEDGGSNDPAHYIAAAERLLSRYKQGDIPFGHFPHTPRALDLAFNVMGEGLRMYKAAKESAPNPKQFFDWTELHFMDIRLAIQKSRDQEHSLDTIEKNVREAVDAAIDEIRGGSPDDTTLKELQFVHIALNNWMEKAEKLYSEAKSPKDFVAAVKRAFAEQKDDLRKTAPSARSFEAMDFIISQIVMLMEAVQTRYSSKDDFLRIFSPRMDSVMKSYEEGIKSKSLAKVKALTAQAVKTAIESL